MDVTARIHEQLTKCGIKIAASLPDDWVAPLIERIAADNQNPPCPGGARG